MIQIQSARPFFSTSWTFLLLLNSTGVDKCQCEFLGDQADAEVIYSGSLPRLTQASTPVVLARGDELADQRSAHDRSDRRVGVGRVAVG